MRKYIKNIISVLVIWFTCSIALAQKTAISTVVTGPYSNSLTDYMYSGQVVVTYNNKGYCCWMNQYAALTITNTTTGATLKTKAANRIPLTLNGTITTYVLSASDLSTLFSPYSMDFTGLSTAEQTELLNTATLPDGNYSFCFEYWASQSTFPVADETDQTSNYCAFNINISKAAQLINVSASMSRPMIERSYDWFKNNANLSITNTSNIRSYSNVSMYIKITGDNGVSITTKPQKCTALMKFTVRPSTPYIATTADLQSWFNETDMDIVGLNTTQFLTDKLLPNGNYQLCFIAHSMTMNCTEELSNSSLGCVNFTIQADPIHFAISSTPITQNKISDIRNNQIAVNMSTQSVYNYARIGIRIKGDNGVELASYKGGRVGAPPTYAFSAGIPKQLTTADLNWLFSADKLEVKSGLDATKFLLDGELPDGTYDLCFEAFDENDVLISTTAGSCELPFQLGNSGGGITSVHEAPMLISPICGDSARTTFPQNLVFTWMAPSSFNVQTNRLTAQQYILRIVEMHEFEDAWDAVRKATTPYFFEKVVTGTNYIYGAANGDPLLERGKKYAFYVQIYSDRSNYRNQGRSDVCWFSWGGTKNDTIKKTISNDIKPKKTNSTKKDKIIVDKPVCGETPFNRGLLSLVWKPVANKGVGKVIYLVEIREHGKINFAQNKIKYSEVTEETKVLQEAGLVKLEDGKRYQYKIYAADIKNNLLAESDVCEFTYKFYEDKKKVPSGDVAVTGQILYTCAAKEGVFVYNNGSITIKETYFIADPNSLTEEKYIFSSNPITKEPLQTWDTKTDPNGKFAHKVDLGKFGSVENNYSFKSKYGTFNGVLMHGVEVIINNPYYENTSKRYVTGENGNLDIGKIMSSVFTFDLKVNVKKGYKESEIQSNCYDCIVSLYALHKTPPMVPQFKKENEILVLPALSPYKYDIIDATKTVKKTEYGKEVTQVVFKNLICTKTQNHHYFINAQYEDLSTGKEISRGFEGTMYTDYTFISPKPPKSKVKGQIFYAYKDNNTALPLSASLLLKVCYVFESKTGKKYVLNQFNAKQNDVGTGGMIYSLMNDINAKFTDNEKSVGYTVSNSSGEFEFNFENIENYSDQTSNIDMSSGGGEFQSKLQGKVYRCLRVVVNNSYYTNPDNEIFIEPLETINVGKLTAYVRAVDIKVVCKSMKYENQAITSGGAVFGLDVAVFRKGPIPNYFPGNEGDIYKQNNVPEKYKKNNKYISYGQSNAEGEVTFKGIVINNNKEFEKITIYAESPELKGELNYFSAYDFNFSPSELDDGYKNNGTWTANNINFYPDAIYNSDFNTPTIVVTMTMIPMPPVIRGRVMDISKSNTGLASAGATLMRKLTKVGAENEYEFKTTKTDDQGYFELTDLAFKKDVGWGVLSDEVRLNIGKLGYFYKLVDGQKVGYSDNLGKLKDGEKRVLPEIYLTPNATLKGSIKDEAGAAVEAYVAVLGSDLKETNIVSDKNFNSYSNYEIYSPPGKNVKIVVWPKDLKYFIDTLTVAEVKNGNNVFDIVVKKRLHRFKFNVYTMKNEKKGNFFMEKKVFLEGCRIEIEGHSTKTNSVGEAYLEFANTSTKNFYAKIWGPNGENYIQEFAAITNYESAKKSQATITDVKLEQGRFITGNVTLNGTPFKGAIIEEVRPQTMPVNSVRSNEAGNYNLGSLNTVSTNVVLIKVYVPSELQKESTIFGKEIKVDLTGMASKTVNIELEEWAGANISEFYGHKIEITNYKKLNNEEIAVSGYVILENDNSYFIPKENNKLAFSNLRYKIAPKGNGKYTLASSQPVDDVLVTDKLMIYTSYGKNINVLFAAPDWVLGKTIKFVKAGSKAEMKGVATIVDNSFDFPGSYLSFGKSIFFFGEKEKTGLEKLIVTGAISNKSKTKAFNICGWEGKPISYKFLQFDAESDPQESFIKLVNEEARLYMKTKIFAKFENMTPSNLMIDLGTFEMNHEKIFPLTGKENIKFNLESWVVEVKNWQVTTDKGGITSSEGFITAGSVNVPFTYFHMQNNLLKFQDFKLQDLNLGNVTKLEIGKNTTPIFGFDNATGTNKGAHWKMTLVGNAQNPAASFGGLEGLEPGKKVNIEVLSMISNGEQLLSFGADAEPLLLYNVVKFKPSTISSYADYFTMGGILDVNIPKISKDLTAILKVTKKGSAGKIEILPQQIDFEGKGFVQFKSLGTAKQIQKIEPNKLTWVGTVTEPGKTPIFDCVLTKEGYLGDAKIDLVANQKVLFGTTKLINVKGSKYVKDGDWDYLQFEGDLDGLTGVNDAAKHLKFTVYGDIKAEGQQIKMDNINTPFGGMELAFDLEKQRLTGHMDVDMDFSESGHVQGVANLVFDKDGFLINLSAQVSFPQPIGTYNAGILLGTYTNIPDQFLTDVVKYNYNKKIPCHLKTEGLTGFFITGARKLPLNIEPFSVDIPPGLALVSLYCGAESGLEMQLGMNFKGGLKLNANALIYAHAWGGINAITCTEASADATGELLINGWYENGNFAITGCGSVVLKVKGSQKVPVLVGCSDPSIDLDTELGVKYIIEIGSGGFKNDVEFMLGKATGCTALLNCEGK